MLIVNNEAGRMRISGVIGEDVQADEIAEALYDFGGKDIRIDLQSPGGIIDEGFGIYDLLRDYEGQVEARLQGMVASIATVVMLGADEVVASEAATVMIHDAWGVAIGNQHELRASADNLAILSGQMAELYAQKSGRSASYWLELMSKEVYLSPQEALETGLVDRVIEGTGKKRAEQNERSNFAPIARVRGAVATYSGDEAKLRARIARLRGNC